jgi:hypothetical protein
MNTEKKTTSLFSTPYLDKYNECYKNIITISAIPQGPCSKLIKRINLPILSPFKNNSPCNKIKTCCLGLTSPKEFPNCCNDNLMVVDDVPNLISFLLENNYKVDTSITKMLNQSEIRFETNNGNKLICLITYDP